MKPGTTVRLNRHCPWPQRRGVLAVVVNTEGAENKYPVHGLGSNEVVVRIDEDPIAMLQPFTLTNGEVWSCVVPLTALDPVEES